MAVDLDALNEAVESPERLAVTRVRDAAELAGWTETLARGFGEGPHEAEWVGAMYGRIGLGDNTAWRHYLARLDRAPVATASMLFAAGVAGIYFVFTVEEARRRGIGAAITLAALREARAMGYRAGVLGSSRMGESVYRRLGFREYCRLSIYDWRPG
jgi:GNAT superfamily N-acetyltransferase